MFLLKRGCTLVSTEDENLWIHLWQQMQAGAAPVKTSVEAFQRAEK